MAQQRVGFQLSRTHHRFDEVRTAVRAGDAYYLPSLNGLESGGDTAPVAGQTRRALERARELLGNEQLDFSHVVKCHVFLADIASYAEMNAAYAEAFEPGRYPARTTVEVAALRGGAAVEIACVAFADRSRIEIVVPGERDLPRPMGPHSAAVWAGGTLYVSGQSGRNPRTGEAAVEAGAQAQQTLHNIATILRSSGLDQTRLLQLEAYYPRTEGEIAGEALLERRWPAGSGCARSAFPVTQIPGGMGLEFTAVAAANGVAIARLIPHEHAPSAVIAAGTLYLSTQLSNDPANVFEAQFRDAMRRLRTTLLAAGLDYRHIVQLTLLQPDVADSPLLYAMLHEFFGGHHPAVTLVGIRRDSPRDARVRISAVAVR